MQRLLSLTLIAITALTVGGCTVPMAGETMAGVDHSQMMSDTQTMTATGTLSDTQMGGMDHSMMNVDPAKPFDAQFIDGMIEHHQGAIVMAEQALQQAEHEELRTLAEAIIAAQGPEIEQMTTLRQSWYPDLAPTGGMAMDMGDMEISMDEGKSFDQRFLDAMISHHQGAIDMATMAQQMAEHQEIKDLSAAIITAQQTEIEQMQGWLQVWFGGSQ